MKDRIAGLLFITCLSVSVGFSVSERPSAKITVRVRANDDSVVTGIVVGVTTFWQLLPGDGFGRDENKTVTDVTDTNGLVTLIVPSLTGEIAYGARPFCGFYENYSARIGFTNSIAGKWQPWNPTEELRLERIINPLPMFARKYGQFKPGKIPELGKLVGFDLQKADWVAPYGIGDNADFNFKVDAQIGGTTANGYQIHDSSFTVSFSNDGDGIQSVYAQPSKGSALRLPRFAPEQGYETNLIRRAYRHEEGGHIDKREDQNYFFRVRTKKDEKGNIVSALYGKIHGEFRWGQNGGILFTYYLNPTPSDRNLEFDPKRNLFKDLKSTEQVTDP